MGYSLIDYEGDVGWSGKRHFETSFHTFSGTVFMKYAKLKKFKQMVYKTKSRLLMSRFDYTNVHI